MSIELVLLKSSSTPIATTPVGSSFCCWFSPSLIFDQTSSFFFWLTFRSTKI